MTQAISPLIAEYLSTLTGKSTATVDAYRRALRDICAWIAARPTGDGTFVPDALTRTALETYLAHLAANGASISHRARVKTVVSGFARWLIDEKELLRRNPARGITLPPQTLLAPRELSPDQRYVLRSLVERAHDLRGEALFALGYWAGCRVSDTAWLRFADAHLGPKSGWLRVGYKGGRVREIELCNEARRALFT